MSASVGRTQCHAIPKQRFCSKTEATLRSTTTMVRLSDIRIGTKLFMMSGLGVLLVAGMIVTQMHGNSSVKSANEAAALQQHLSHDLLAAKVVERGMQISVRDVRLARTSQDLESAVKTLETRIKAGHQRIDPLISQFRNPENRARAEKLKSVFDQYFAGAKEIAALKTQTIDLQSRASAADEAD